MIESLGWLRLETLRRIPRLRASPRHGGAKQFYFQSVRPPRGALRGGGKYPNERIKSFFAHYNNGKFLLIVRREQI